MGCLRRALPLSDSAPSLGAFPAHLLLHNLTSLIPRVPGARKGPSNPYGISGADLSLHSRFPSRLWSPLACAGVQTDPAVTSPCTITEYLRDGLAVSQRPSWVKAGAPVHQARATPDASQ